MTSPDKILRTLRVTEKSSALTANLNQYTFEVARRADRKEVAEAIEATFNVKVARVNIINQIGKRSRSRARRGVAGSKPAIKKAIVTLAQGESIDIA